MSKGLSPSGRRTKGHSFERRIAQDLREVWPDAKRGYQTRGGTAEAPDVDGTPYFLECKAQARPNIAAALRQAAEASDGRPPVAVTKADRNPTLVTMYLSDWLDMAAEARPEDWSETWDPGDEF